jgi:hypothetical protein
MLLTMPKVMFQAGVSFIGLRFLVSFAVVFLLD